MTLTLGKGARLHKGGLTCGYPGKVSQLSWTYIDSGEKGDYYELTRVFPADTEDARTYKKKIHYKGERVVVFEDNSQVIVIEPPKPGGAGD